MSLRRSTRLCFHEAAEHVRAVAHENLEERAAVYLSKLGHCHSLEDVGLLEVHGVNGLRRAMEIDSGVLLSLKGRTTERSEEARRGIPPTSEPSEGHCCGIAPWREGGAFRSCSRRITRTGRMASSWDQACSNSSGATCTPGERLR